METLSKEKELECVGNNWLHNYEIIDQKDGMTREYCKRCKQEQTFYTGDNKTYYKHHRRDYLQPHQFLFHREWGEPNYVHEKQDGDTTV